MGYETNIGLNDAISGALFDFLGNSFNVIENTFENFMNKYNDNFKDLANNLNNFLDLIAPQWTKDFIADLYDPLVLDLDGDGKISLSENNVYFDHNGDGVVFISSWIAPNDGLLAVVNL